MRFRYRHVQQTVADYVTTRLAELGWSGATVNFGTNPVTVIDVQPDEAGRQIVPNTIAVTLGNEPEDALEELGGGLYSTAFPIFVDIYGTSSAISVSIASDVKAVLQEKVLHVKDYSRTPPVESGEFMVIENVSFARPDAAGGADFRRFWRVVRATGTVYHRGSE
jgi:hypothetical protein